MQVIEQDEPVRHQAKNSRFKKGYHSRLLDFSDDGDDDDDNDKEYESSSTYMDSVRQEHKSNKQYGFGHDLGIVRSPKPAPITQSFDEMRTDVRDKIQKQSHQICFSIKLLIWRLVQELIDLMDKKVLAAISSSTNLKTNLLSLIYIF